MNDIPQQFILAITAKDIANGTPNDCHLCPIALALNRTFPIADGWRAFRASALAFDGENDRSFFHNGAGFVAIVDAGGRAEPTILQFYQLRNEL